MNVEGFLTQPHSTPGTVALVASDGSVLSVAATTPNGRYSLACAAVPPDAVLYGFPNVVLTAAQVPNALSAGASGPVYRAGIPAGAGPGALIYLNAASTAVRAAQAANAALTPAQADAHVKAHLFGSAVAKFMPGYSAGFLTHVAAPRVLSFPLLQAAADAAGGWSAWADAVARTPPPARAAFAAVRPARVPDPEPVALPEEPAGWTKLSARPASPVPTIPETALWSSDDMTWLDVLSAEDGAFAESMENLAETTDGIAASVTESAFATTASDLLSWGGKELAAGVVSAVGGQLFSLVCSWAFSSGSSSTTATLQQINQQLTTLVNNQAAIIQQLSQVLDELDQLNVDIVSEAMLPAISNIQTTVQQVSGYATTTTGTASAELATLAPQILDVDGGVVDSLQEIHNAIMSQGGATSLPAALVKVATRAGGVYGTAQNLLSNGNCFGPAQWLFHYYAMLQTQGVQLVIQAQNFQANSAVTSADTPLVVSPEALAAYNATLIGGAGRGSGPDTMPPNLVQQRDLFRACFWRYYHRCEGSLGPLPDDMATAFVPKVTGQVATLYYETQSGLLVLGHLSGKLRNWSAGTDVLAKNAGLLGNGWPLPSVPGGWRFPKAAEFGQIFQPTGGLSRYGGWNLFQYLYDQGFTDDRTDYGAGFTFTMLFSGDSAYYGDAWDTCTYAMSPQPSFEHPPFDINGNAIAASTRKNETRPWEPWYYCFQGTWPSALRTDNSFHFISSQCYNIYAPGDPSQGWAHPWFQVSGGFVVATPAGYVPPGSYTQSCTDIKVTLTGNAQTADGGTVPFTFDLTPHAGIALQNNHGVLEVTNPFKASPPADRTAYLPPGPYQSSCTNLAVTLSCQAQGADGAYVNATYDLTNAPIAIAPLGNLNGVIVAESQLPAPPPPPPPPNRWNSGGRPWSN